MKYLAVLGRQPKISLAELEALFGGENVVQIAPELAEIESKSELPQRQIKDLGGTQKIAVKIEQPITKFLETLPETGKITLGLSDYSRGASAFRAQGEALKLKRILSKMGRSVRVVPNKAAALSSATSYHNHLWGEAKIELIKLEKRFYRVVQVQNIDAYALRDQERPARDAKVGMLPPKLAQILINLGGQRGAGERLLDPFCGTGVVLQEALLMGFVPYGTDLSERMVEYSEKNLGWLISKSENSFASTRSSRGSSSRARASYSSDRRPADGFSKRVLTNRSKPVIQQGDATSFRWQAPVDRVACEVYLGPPMSLPPAEIKLKQAKMECRTIILGFLQNLAEQIKSETPVVIAVPAWLRPNGQYERLNILDEIQKLGYNVRRFRNVGQEDLLYHREKQVVAREIIVLRKK